MHLLGERTLGVVILVLLGVLVTVKRVATGSALDRPKGGLLVQAVNVFNLFFLLVANPVAAVLLIARWLAVNDPTHATIADPALTILEITGLILYVAGFLLMAAAMLTLGENYQLGGCSPRPGDSLVGKGPYRLVRHPMYLAAWCISLGLSCLIQSWAAFGVFCVYVVLVLLLVPTEEKGLRNAYGEQYAALQRGTRRLIPFVY
jgi:protein-S-isoprenylcysteine O-methyltransferase Ste14